MAEKLTWTDIEEIGYRLFEQNPQQDPLSVRFTDLRQLVEQLPSFEPEPGQQVNEQILEAIQAAWLEERDDDDDRGDEDDEPHYHPASPFRPDPSA